MHELVGRECLDVVSSNKIVEGAETDSELNEHGAIQNSDNDPWPALKPCCSFCECLPLLGRADERGNILTSWWLLCSFELLDGSPNHLHSKTRVKAYSSSYN